MKYGKNKDIRKERYGSYVFYVGRIEENEYSLDSFRKKLDEIESELVELGCKAFIVEVASREYGDSSVGIFEVHGERVENEEEKAERLAAEKADKQARLDRMKVEFERLKASLDKEGSES